MIKRDFNYYVFENKKKSINKKRIKSDIWKNLYEFHLEEGSKENKTIKELKKSED